MTALFLTAAVWAGNQNYKVILLGDLHYDAPDIRVNQDKLAACRKREMHHNLKAREKNIPIMPCMFSSSHLGWVCSEYRQGGRGNQV